MPRTSSSAWKRAEQRLAALFGCKRRPLSGNTSGRDDQDGSDSTHGVLFLECKLRAKHTVWSLWDACKKRAKGKPVVIGIQEKHRPGMMICVHSDDLDKLCDERIRARAQWMADDWIPVLAANRSKDE